MHAWMQGVHAVLPLVDPFAFDWLAAAIDLPMKRPMKQATQQRARTRVPVSQEAGLTESRLQRSTGWTEHCLEHESGLNKRTEPG